LKKHYQNFVNKILGFLQQGISPEKLALGLAFGVTLGIIPLLGATTLLCFLAALLFRLNIPFIQLVHYVISPIQILLFIPFLHEGVELFSNERVHYTLEEITTMVSTDLVEAITKLFFINLYGLLLWLMVAPFIFALAYFLGLNIFRKSLNNFNKTK
jgi:uncharacterized protein (DUF2062 family)